MQEPQLGRVAHIPAWNDAYQQHLMAGLRGHGVDATLAFGVARFGIDLTIVAGLIRGSIREALHLHWQHPYLVRRTLIGSALSACFFLVQLLLARVAGVRIVWTIHNLKNHENNFRGLERLACWFVARLAHRIVVHCERAREQAEVWLGRPHAEKLVVIPHGGFADLKQGSPERAEARRALGIKASTFVFLHLGLVRRYKGLEDLLDAFRSVSGDDVSLILAGKCRDPGLEADLGVKSKGLMVVRVPEYVAPSNVQQLMAAADVVVCPYRDILTSGGVIAAMSFGKPVVAPALGCIPEVLTSDGGFLYCPERVDGLEMALRMALDCTQDDLEARGQINHDICEDLDWVSIADHTVPLYGFRSHD